MTVSIAAGSCRAVPDTGSPRYAMPDHLCERVRTEVSGVNYRRWFAMAENAVEGVGNYPDLYMPTMSANSNRRGCGFAPESFRRRAGLIVDATVTGST